jgi:two-component SAPR family response regulator
MPKMGGMELAERIKEIQPHVKILFTSGYMENDSLKNSIDHFNAEFLAKPFAPGKLVETIRSLL